MSPRPLSGGVFKFFNMRCKFGSIVVDGRGKAGGHFFSRAKSGNFLATNRYGGQRQSLTFPSFKTVMAGTASLFKTLDPIEYLGWESMARQVSRTNVFGDSYNPSTFQLFCELMSRKNKYHNNNLTTPPPFPPDETVEAVVMVNTGDGSVQLDVQVKASTQSKLIVFASPPSLTPASFNYKKPVFIQNNNISGETFLVDLPTYPFFYPYYEEGQSINFLLFIVSQDGWKSNEYRLTGAV